MTTTLLHVTATFECEGCGKPFGVMIFNDDRTVEDRPTIYELAVEHLRSGHSSSPLHHGLCSHYEEVPLCPGCTRSILAHCVAERMTIDDVSREWILSKLHAVIPRSVA